MGHGVMVKVQNSGWILIWARPSEPGRIFTAQLSRRSYAVDAAELIRDVIEFREV